MKRISQHNALKPLRAALMLLSAVAFLFGLGFSGSSEASETIGVVAKKRMDVYGTPPEGDRDRKFPHNNVAFGELIETSGGGAILMRMSDATELYLGEHASLVIDDFVYDPQSASHNAIYTFAQGTLRYVSGEMGGKGVTIQTPNSYIGIRGSEAIIFVTPVGDTFVNVTKGSFTVRSRAREDMPAVTVEAGQNVSLVGQATFSPIGKGIQIPEGAAPGERVANYKTDLDTLQDGGGLDKAREGSGDSSGSSGGSSGGGGGHSF